VFAENSPSSTLMLPVGIRTSVMQRLKASAFGTQSRWA
jgi:hypothetical protein